MPSLRDQILAFALSRPQGATLTQIADAVGRNLAGVSYHLTALVREGLLRREEGKGRPSYHAQPYFSARWLSPEMGRAIEWVIPDTISWRYPLTSRIADKRARDAVLLLLREAEWRGWLADPARIVPGRKHPRPKARDPAWARTHGLRFVVYGSVARRDVSAASDVDVLVLPGSALDAALLREALKDLAAELNLASPRRIDLNVLHQGANPPRVILDAVRREGFVVFSTYEGGEIEPLLQEVVH